MVMTVMVFMGSTLVPIVAENVRAWRIFATKAGNNRGRRHMRPRNALGGKKKLAGASLHPSRRIASDSVQDEIINWPPHHAHRARRREDEPRRMRPRPRALHGRSTTQVQSSRLPREATEPAGHIGLVMSSQKQKRTATSATLNSRRGFIYEPQPFALPSRQWRSIASLFNGRPAPHRSDRTQS